MNSRGLPRWTAVVLSALILGAATAGCGGDSTTTPPATAKPTSSPTPASVKDLLIAAAPHAGTGRFRFTMKDDTLSGTGINDPAARTEQTNLRIALGVGAAVMKVDLVVVDQKCWIRIGFTPASGPGLPRVPKTWMTLDPAKVTDPKAPVRYRGPDPAESAKVFEGIVSAQPIGPGIYDGTVDLTQATDTNILGDDEFKALGDRIKSVPFRASVDEQGRLVTVTYDIPPSGKAAAYQQTAGYSNYGAAPAISTPTGKIVPAPAAVYRLLNS